MRRREKQRPAFLADAESFRGAPDDDVSVVYDRVADRCDRFRELWLRLAGAAAETAMLADLRTVLRPGAKVLDAGCGTGVLARKMRELQPEIELTLIDLSAAMPRPHNGGSAPEVLQGWGARAAERSLQRGLAADARVRWSGRNSLLEQRASSTMYGVSERVLDRTLSLPETERRSRRLASDQ